MNLKNLFISGLIYVVFTGMPALSQVQPASMSQSSKSLSSENLTTRNYTQINWGKLNLSSEQMEKIQSLDKEWMRIQQLIRPKIIRDQQQLKNIMSNPEVDEDLIRKLQRDIMLRQEQLRYEATENFLSKRRILTSEQREKLHKMVSP
jgi:Spy/CpxP family protein refolding chaperone